MATIDHLFDSGRGKLGNLVFYKVGGRGRVRTRPARYRDRKSPAQLAQRQRLQVVLDFLKPFSNLIRITFKEEAVGRSAMQAAQSYLMRNALEGEYPQIYVDKSKALLCRGPLPGPVSATVTARPDGLLVEWENEAQTAARHPHDTLLVMALLTDTGVAAYRFTEARRSDGRYLWTSGWPDGPRDVWIAFRNPGETHMSDSFYIAPNTDP